MTISSTEPTGDAQVMQNGNSGVEPTIKVSNVSKWFGDVVSVNDVSLEVRPGLTGLLGPNGAGKTTLLRMICGLTRPSGGEITVLGESVRNNPQLYRRIGVMPEHQSTYDFMTGREFVELNARLQQVPDVSEAVDRAIEQVDMQDAQNRSIGGYSRGMKQRMRLAAVMVHDPEILLLDEPLSGTDPRQRI
jgi:ABC-2 type transport system ATP-binding protein